MKRKFPDRFVISSKCLDLWWTGKNWIDCCASTKHRFDYKYATNMADVLLKDKKNCIKKLKIAHIKIGYRGPVYVSQYEILPFKGNLRRFLVSNHLY